VNRCIVVPGASKGIGLASAEILNARGWSVIGIARHQPKAAGELLSGPSAYRGTIAAAS